MPRKIDIITELYRRSMKNVTSDSKQWKKFLDTVAWQYKYPFSDQLLIHAQKPFSTACAELEIWNSRFGRYVNKGSHGIALLREKGGRVYLSHVFDVGDTHPTKLMPDIFHLWEAKDYMEEEITVSLENNFGKLENKENLIQAVISASDNICEDNLTDYIENLESDLQGSYLEGLSHEDIKCKYLNLLKVSVAYTVLTRLGYKADIYLDNDFFTEVFEFNTEATIGCIGTATGDLSEYCLRSIEKTVRTFEKNKKEYYTERAKKSNLKRKGEKEYETNDLGLQRGRKIDDDTRFKTSETEKTTIGQVRNDEARFYKEAQKGDLYNADWNSQTDGTSVRSGTGSQKGNLGDYEETGDETWSDGRTESQRPNEVGNDDEQYEAVRRGGSSEHPDLHVKELPSPEADTVIQGLRHGDYLLQNKETIVSFLLTENDEEKKTEYIKSVYPIGLYGEFFKKGTKDHIGIHPTEEGLTIYEGNYLTHTTEASFSWDLTRQLIEALIEDKNYLDAPKPSKAGEQLSFFDSDSVSTLEDNKPMATDELRISPFAIPQEVIDEFLRLGGCTRQSTERIYGFYRRANDQDENIKFLRREYEIDTVGIVSNGKNYAVRWNDDGVYISKGNKVSTISNTFLNWADIDNRIRYLIENGMYLPKSQAKHADAIWEETVADKISFLYRDTFENIPKEFKMEDSFQWPDVRKFYVDILHEPIQLKGLIMQMEANVKRLEEYPPRFRIWTNPEEVIALTKTFLREPIDFQEANPNILPPQQFITEDKINDFLIHYGSGMSEGKLRIYSQFLLEKDNQKRAAFLSNEFGTGGTGGTRTDNSHDGKGLLIYGGLMSSNSGVLLKWTQVAKRIDELIKAGKYLTEKEKTSLDSYEKEQLARMIQGFYQDKGEDVQKPYDKSSGELYDERINQILPQLEDNGRVKEILSMMEEAFETEMPGSFRYDYDKQCVETIRNFVDGKYNLFPHSPYRKKQEVFKEELPEKANQIEPAQELVQDVDLSDLGYDLPLGTWVYIGQNEVQLEKISKDGVELFDGTMFPMELTLEQFIERVKENPLNDHLKTKETTDEWTEQHTPETQYEQLKKAFPDSVAAVRVGDFIEFQREDAQIAEKHLDLTLTTRKLDNEEISICGVPFDKSEQYINKLLECGYSVSMVDGDGEPVIQLTPEDLKREPTEEKLDEYPISTVEDGEVKTYDNAEKLLEKANLELPNFVQKGKPKRLSPTVFHPEISDSEKHDFVIENSEIGTGGAKEKFKRNKEAINLLHSLEFENRIATVEEQKILAQYSGWGGLSDAFDESKDNWSEEFKELYASLSPEEYEAARESTLTAFYTPPVVIESIYKALSNMGFEQGNILEPSCGVGNFIGMLPENMRQSKVYGVELDSISGRIAQQLYQKESIMIGGYESTSLPDSFFDVAVGNVPFGQFKVLDRKYNKFNFLVHDFFFAKTLDKVRPGGVIAFVTSKGTLDKENPSVRKYIAERADFLGAIRLPNNTFKGAGTEVVSDIIFLQKRDRIVESEPDWVHLGTDENGITMNQYFVDNPEMILGDVVMESGPFGEQLTVKPYEDQDLSELLSEAVSNIHAEYEVSDEELSEDVDDGIIPADPDVRNFSYTLYAGKVYYRKNSVMLPVETSVTGENRIKGMIALRETVRSLIDAQLEEGTDAEINALQSILNRQYDEFTKKYGLINSRANESAFNDDNAYFLLSSLEILDDDKQLKAKADMFTKRTIKPYIKVDKVDTASEALAISLSERAFVDIPFMCELTSKSEEEILSELKGIVFRNPQYINENCGEKEFVTADEYLSGNVREKLDMAKRSAKLYPDDYTENVKALEAVQPVDLTAAEIGVKLGSTWIPDDIIQEFIYELLETPTWARWNIQVKYVAATSQWVIAGKSYDRSNIRASSVYGTQRANAYHIIEETLNLKTVKIYDYIEDANGSKKAVLNKKETTIAQGKQEEIKRVFSEWIWKDPERRETLCKLYNEQFNSLRPREYNGEHIHFYGMNPEITLRNHQKNAVARIMYGGNSLLAHVVGAGKTYTMTAAAQEMKRLGLCHKSMFVVPNHLVEQWASEYLQLYPAANILVTTKKDFETKNRKKFCARIATGDYDAIIIGHSQFEKIPVSLKRQKSVLEKEIEEITDGISELKYQRGERITVKQLMKTRKQLESKLEKLNDQTRKDDVVCFEELGVDRLFIDEAHFYKNLFLYSKMQNVAGISQTEAQKSSDLFMKCRYMDELTGGKGVIFATGTPISNSMVELYTMQRYLQYDELKYRGLSAFDSWASTFGETVTAIELSPAGSGYRTKTRFAKFYNIPELMAMFKQVADVQTSDMLQLPVPKANYHVSKVPASEIQKNMVESFAERAERIHNGMVNSSVDNMLLVTNDGRKAALDQRLINDALPDEEGSKVNDCVQNVFEIWERTKDKKSAQLVFCDLSTPKSDGTFNIYDDIREKLIAKGIPPEEIAFIHSANNDAKKKELFAKVRSGQVRILMGSTFKMGAGTNVQTRLIALHDLDCPWRPSDLEQRSGRIIRQGNGNDEVEIYRYVTEGTFDAYMYQLVESKQKFISQIMTSKTPLRMAEDVDETVLSYAEIKALATGNPKIMEKMQLDADVAKLKLQKASHLSQRYMLEDKLIKDYPQQLTEVKAKIKGFEEDKATVESNTFPNEKGFSPMIIMGETFTEKAEAGKKILEICKRITNPDARHLGEYRGLKTNIGFDTFSKEFFIELKGKITYKVMLGSDANGIITRLDNAIDGISNRIANAQNQLADIENQMANAKAEIEKPFVGEGELSEKMKRLDELNSELNMDKAENELVDAESEKDGETEESPEEEQEQSCDYER